MRWLLRMVLLWAISAPLFYVFGLPYLLDYMNQKIHREQYAQCFTHLKDEGMLSPVNPAMTQAQAETYCHCVSDGLTFTKNDLWDAVQKKEPAAFTAGAQKLADSCAHDLRISQGIIPPDGAEVTYINP